MIYLLFFRTLSTNQNGNQRVAVAAKKVNLHSFHRTQNGSQIITVDHFRKGCFRIVRLAALIIMFILYHIWWRCSNG